MMQLLCNGTFLDLYDNAGLQFTHSNPLFAFDELKCERTTNFKLPATPTNDRVFSLAKIPAYSGDGMRRKFTCQLQAGTVVRDGYLYVANFDGKDYNAVFVTGELVGLQRIKDLGKLSELIEYTEAETYGGAGVSPTAAQYDIWRNVNYLKPAGDTLRPSLNGSRLYYDILLKNGIPAAPLPSILEGMRIIPSELKGADTSLRFKCTIRENSGQPSTDEPTTNYNTLEFNTGLFEYEDVLYNVSIINKTQYFLVRQYKCKTNLSIVIPDNWLSTSYIFDFSGAKFYGDRYFDHDVNQNVVPHGELLAGRTVEFSAGDCFSFVDSRYHVNRYEKISGQTVRDYGFILYDTPTFNTDYTIEVKTDAETGNLVRAQDNLPDITFIEYCKTLAALQGKVLNYKESGYTNLFPMLQVVPNVLSNDTYMIYDKTTCTITSTRRNNTNPTSNTLYAFLSDGNMFTLLYEKKTTGVFNFTFVKPNNDYMLRFGFNGNITNSYLWVKLPSSLNGKTLTLWGNVTVLDRTNTGNDAQVANLCLVEGSSEVTWSQWQSNIKGIVFDDINYNSYATKELANILKKGEVVRTFGAYAQNNLVQFDDEKADRLQVNYTIDNENLDTQKELHKIPFSEGLLRDNVLYIIKDSEKDVIGLNTGGANLGRVQLPKNANLQALCTASTQLKIDVRMSMYEYDQINEHTRILCEGTLYLWTSRSWQNDVAKFTLAKV